ncbi:hypothetical protein NM688_g6153 [Phlebia brevispora]|uniref:Uncharacterized protein n=1 Tax=Phlebia brevispora TaxID=194682 RepID=A0ACC1SJE5_9APHY|nr:hypothetical protein NM688_g6153 [Phlebia brevispora]
MLHVFRVAFAALSAATFVAARAFPELLGRTTSDECANVNAALSVTSILHIPIEVGWIDLCFCLSDVPDLLKTNPVAIEAVILAGANAVTSALEDLVKSAKDHKTCSSPEHADLVCSPSDPCSFKCKDGFVPYPPYNPTECVCQQPNKVCNGVCGFFPGHSCPSSVPKKREVEMQYKRATCAKGYTACGVYGWQGFGSAEAWECVDTASDLESCGGCMVPFGRTPAHGVDCTAILGVMDVSCAAGSCLVERCLPGYTVSQDRSFCVRSNDVELLASEYGLEHIPLKREPSA